MTGTHKLKPLVISNCLKPYIFSHKRIQLVCLPVEFHANKNAWMTANTTSVTKPMDQAIIASFKPHY